MRLRALLSAPWAAGRGSVGVDDHPGHAWIRCNFGDLLTIARNVIARDALSGPFLTAKAASCTRCAAHILARRRCGGRARASGRPVATCPRRAPAETRRSPSVSRCETSAPSTGHGNLRQGAANVLALAFRLARRHSNRPPGNNNEIAGNMFMSAVMRD